MFSNLKGKRLLFLGAVRPLCEAVQVAREMGIYTVVTDYLPNSPAKKYADKACMVSAIDVDAVVALCKEEKIDGLFTAFTDSLLPYARKICDKLGFPFYASEQQIALSLDKSLFKKTCMEYDVPVPIDYTDAIKQNGIENVDINFPVIVKPIDSSGGRGISICNNADEFKVAYNYALNISPGKNVLVEEYVIGDEVTATYTMKNGEVSLSCFKDKLISRDHEGITSQGDVLIVPSKYTERFCQDINKKVINMFKGMGATDGSVFVQGIVNDTSIKFFELGYRINGACDYRHISSENKINYLKMMIAHALTGEMQGYSLEQDDPHFKHYILTYNMWAHGGTVGELSDIEEIKNMPNVVTTEYLHSIGDEIIDNHTLAQRVFRAVIKDKSVDRIKEIQKIVKVNDSNGANMLYKSFDTNRLDEYKNIEE